jgi:PAS domain S-box-containing protein
MTRALDAEQAALRASEERFRLLFDRASDGILIQAPDGKILAANESFVRMHGYSLEDLAALTVSDLETPVASKLAPERMRRVLSGESLAFEAEHLHRDRHVLSLEVTMSLIDSKAEQMVQSLYRDVSDRKVLEAQLRESQKMEALGVLAGGVAHEFNNIITAIIGNLELARQDVGAGHEAAVCLEEIGKASRRAKDLVQQILAFGRPQGLVRNVMSLGPVVEEAARLLRATLPVGVSLKVACAPDAPPALADATQVQHMLLNLCSNAIYAIGRSGRPGRVEIRLEADRADARSPRCACLTVHDDGPGMDEATRQRVFEPFFTTKPVGEGTGLGMAVVLSMVEEHRARIEVVSEPGKGATFRVHFPPVEPEIPAAVPEAATGLEAAESAGAVALQGEGKRILYVDDDEAIVFLMERLLERRGYRVSGYTDARKALAAVRDEPAAFDLVVTDYNMPGLSGLDVARAVREIRADLPVAIASGVLTEELKALAPTVGVFELIYKPNTVDELCDVVARLVSRTG